MPPLKTFLLMLASIAFIAVIGSAIYEHVAVVPQWSAAPPLSLSMFQGKYGLNPAPLWQSIHPVVMLLMVASLIANWRSERRKAIATVVGMYVMILVVTGIYFVPELIRITTTPFADTTDADLVSRASLWETLSLVRLAILIALSILLLNSLTYSNTNVKQQPS